MADAATQETMQKITGNFSDELTEAGYRIAADQLVDLVRNRFVNSALGKELSEKESMARFFTSETGEAVISFGLAIVLELLPGETALDFRRALASNLRIQAYQELGDAVLGAAGILQEDLDTVMSVLRKKGALKGPENKKADAGVAAQE